VPPRVEQHGGKAVERVARNVRRLRARLGLTQEQLAERAGFGVRRLQDVEAGRGPGVQVRTLDRFAAALEVDVAELLRPAD
jgi:transcriptional regulator with XRE-family HTH domain